MTKPNQTHQTEVLLADSQELKDKAFAIRQEVFVQEQHVSREEEFDEFEEISRHFVALDSLSHPVGAARWRQTDHGIKLERFAVKKTHRGNQIGSLLVRKVLDDIESQLGKGHFLYLHAQVTAVPLYKKFGFTEEGDQFEECDILHYKMTKQI